MIEPGKTTLKWIYTPTDFFGEKITDLLPDYDLVIENGVIIVSMDLDEFKTRPDIRKQLNKKFISYFKGVNLISQRAYTLSQDRVEITHPDGKKDSIIEATCSMHIMTSGTIELVVRNANGEIIADTKAERLNRQKRLGILSTKYRETDPIVDSILTSFEKS